MAYILGRFPKSAINTLLSVDEIQDAIDRHLHPDQFEWSQKRLGIDVARFGLDSTIIFPRQGLAAYKPTEMNGATGPQIAAKVAHIRASWHQEMEFVDGTGGYGSTVVDSLMLAGYSPQEINFSSKALNRPFSSSPSLKDPCDSEFGTENDRLEVKF